MSYAKLFSSITESSLWSEPKEVRLLFVTMLAKANSVGFVEASILGLARVANLEQKEVEGAVAILEAPDPFSKNPELEGRRAMKVPGGWMVLNYEDYRSRSSEEERREYMREYMRKYRLENGCKHSVNNVKRNKNSPSASVSASGKGKSEEEGIPESLRSEAFMAAWADWKKHRREIKKPLTATSMKEQLAQFGEWGEQRSIKAIRHTIRKGWQGLAEEEQAGGSNGTRARPMSFEERKKRIDRLRHDRNQLFKLKQEEHREFTSEEKEEYQGLTQQLKAMEAE